MDNPFISRTITILYMNTQTHIALYIMLSESGLVEFFLLGSFSEFTEFSEKKTSQ